MLHVFRLADDKCRTVHVPPLALLPSFHRATSAVNVDRWVFVNMHGEFISRVVKNLDVRPEGTQDPLESVQCLLRIEVSCISPFHRYCDSQASGCTKTI
jgi:hypothetical protein